MELIDINVIQKCPETYLLAVNDTLNVLAGKWKLPIMASLQFGRKRFKDLEKEIPKITPRMLSKELRDLELNGMVNRIVHDSFPIIIEYEFTTSGKSFKSVIDAMIIWGIEHRQNTLNGSNENLPTTVIDN
ncbi:winged helix-turn-helix transcriptional regulator [Sphingobacterium zeae]|uniref:DNA-binding HxlR family transcriptional regulator n=1 Tax=Sphingobacterium zeae TaxID=1776859 RepID=A0ABU0U739_9SPHI|nr:helix-turn-helix domain-containing protein [Sphingobacterium zeae]MDQ1150787.1 DNA-binding HxlR family transcriptional regulator [Sphingobacterium zeae]